jgi:FixJ family two-component response regulator
MCAQLFRPLTPAQERVARQVATGRSYREIAKRLNLSARTVETYVHRIDDLIERDDEDSTPYRRVFLWAQAEYRSAA